MQYISDQLSSLLRGIYLEFLPDDRVKNVLKMINKDINELKYTLFEDIA